MMRLVLAFLFALTLSAASANNVIINPYTSSGVTTLTKYAHTDTDGSIPSDAAAGDLMILILAAYGSTSGSGAPTGFTTLTEALDSNFRFNLSYQVLAADDLGDPVTNTLSGSLATKGILIFRPDKTITTLEVGSANSEITDGNPAAQVIAGTGQLTPALMFGFYGCNCAALSGISMSPTQEEEIDEPSISQRWRWIIYNQGETPGNVTIDLGDGGNENGLAGFRISVR